MKKLLGLLALAGFVAIASPSKDAEAAMMAPGGASAIQGSVEPLAIEVRRRHRHHHHYHRRHHVIVPHIVVPRVVVPRVHHRHRHYRY